MIKDTKDVMVGLGVADMPSYLNAEAIKVVAGKPLQNNYAYVMPVLLSSGIVGHPSQSSSTLG